MCGVCIDYLGNEVIWEDDHGNVVGPATVVDVFLIHDGGPGLLWAIEHKTEQYLWLDIPLDKVEIVYTGASVDDLPAHMVAEIYFALLLGEDCQLCPRPRLFGLALCQEHELSQYEDAWPRNDEWEPSR